MESTPPRHRTASTEATHARLTSSLIKPLDHCDRARPGPIGLFVVSLFWKFRHLQ